MEILDVPGASTIVHEKNNGAVISQSYTRRLKRVEIGSWWYPHNQPIPKLGYAVMINWGEPAL